MRRALNAVLQVLAVAFVTLTVRARHGVVRMRHWATPTTAAVAAWTLLGVNGWMWLIRPDGWMW